MHKEHVSSKYVNITPSRDECVYTSCYCEENVWKLCEHAKTQTQIHLDEVYAVFISNERKMIPIWKQKSSRGDEPVVWVGTVIWLSYSEHGGNMKPHPCLFLSIMAKKYCSLHCKLLQRSQYNIHHSVCRIITLSYFIRISRDRALFMTRIQSCLSPVLSMFTLQKPSIQIMALNQLSGGSCELFLQIPT
uniref:Protein N-terminal glutamine amidohydrolase n=1 Tax=Salmo trutta TaxID=8032 RepID=A0A674EV96_SALTR